MTITGGKIGIGELGAGPQKYFMGSNAEGNYLYIDTLDYEVMASANNGGGNANLLLQGKEDAVNFSYSGTDGIGSGGIGVFTNSGNGYNMYLEVSDGSNNIGIEGDAVANTMEYTADTHTFNGNTVFANNGTPGSGKVPTGTDGTGAWTWETPGAGGGSLDTVNVANVLSFGADPTGVTDATEAINNAINNNQGKKRVYLPHGTYKVTVTYVAGADSTNKQGIRLLSGIELFGDGPNLTRITIDTTGAGITWNPVTAETNGVFWPIISGDTVHDTKVHDLWIDGNNTQQINFSNNAYTNISQSFRKTIPGIAYRWGYNNHIYNAIIEKTQDYGIEMWGDSLSTIDKVIVTTGGSGGVGFHLGTGRRTITNSLVTNNYADNIRVEFAQNITIENNEISWAKIGHAAAPHNFAGIYFEDSYDFGSIVGNYIHNNSAYGIDLAPNYTNGARVSVLNNLFKNNGNSGALVKGAVIINGNTFLDNGKKTDSVTDTKDAFLGSAIYVYDTLSKVITSNTVIDNYNYQKKIVGGSVYGTLANNTFNSPLSTSNIYDALGGDQQYATKGASNASLPGLQFSPQITLNRYRLYERNSGGTDTLMFQRMTDAISKGILSLSGDDILLNTWSGTNGQFSPHTKINSTYVGGGGAATTRFTQFTELGGNGVGLRLIPTGDPYYNGYMLELVSKPSSANGLYLVGRNVDARNLIYSQNNWPLMLGATSGAWYNYNIPQLTLFPSSNSQFQNTSGSFFPTDNGSTLQVKGSLSTGYVAKTATYTATASDHTINCTANTFTVTLPTAASIAGREYTIVNSGSGTITIATTSSQTFTNIDATPTTLTLAPVGAGAIVSYTVVSNGANWIVTGKVKNE